MEECIQFNDDDDLIGKNVVIVKLGGSSITEKSQNETLNEDALVWVATKLVSVLHEDYLSSDVEFVQKSRTVSFIVVHGAGSFGHQYAYEYGLKGCTCHPECEKKESDNSIRQDNESRTRQQLERRRKFHGLAKTRASVQKLNNVVVSCLNRFGINAVGISPCISISTLQAHGGDELNGVTALVLAIKEALKAGLIPVLHGDAGLYGDFSNGRDSMGSGILSGDTLIQVIATHKLLAQHLRQAIFMTDVEGVYTKDPNLYKDAALLKYIEVDKLSGAVMTDVAVSGSTHKHDVTGGLKMKLGAAIEIARSGISVSIVKCGSISAEQSILGMDTNLGTIVQLSSSMSNGS